MFQPNTQPSLERDTFRRLSRLYILALSVIAFSILLSQGFIQLHLDDQLDDSRTVNVAGRQRMLSQRLAKQLLLLNTSGPDREIQDLSEIENTLGQWVDAHHSLQKGNDSLGLPGKNNKVIQGMFAEIEPYFQDIVTGTEQVLNNWKTDTSRVVQGRALVLEQEARFLEIMDAIVFEYDRAAKAKVNRLKRVEVLLLLLALLVILLEVFFLFRPAAIKIREIIQELVRAEDSANEMTAQIKELYEDREKSLEELRALNFALDQAALFASTGMDGTVKYMSKKFRKLLGVEQEEAKGPLAELMSDNEGQQQYIQELFQGGVRTRIWTGEVQARNAAGEPTWLEMSIVPVSRSGVRQDLLILCSDITSRKQAQLKVDRLKQEQFEEQIKQQKIRSAQVIEAQEEERKRIARDMHDGIGQMLTALRFNLQSVDTSKPQKAFGQLEKINQLASELIKGVRVATFNLTPPELSDYGIGIGLQRLASELAKLTGKNVLFENQTDFEERFDSIVEINLYRIVQEAVNNAVKYADSNYILIRLSHSFDLLSIVVDDDGRGFDVSQTPENGASKDGTGMGIPFMRERIKFINGRLFIHSRPGEGTRITINMPIIRESARKFFPLARNT